MKKAITLILALTLCAGLTMTGFAAQKYYLANQRLEVEAPETDDDERQAPQPGNEEPEPAPANTNNNPGTGR